MWVWRKEREEREVYMMNITAKLGFDIEKKNLRIHILLVEKSYISVYIYTPVQTSNDMCIYGVSSSQLCFPSFAQFG